MKLKVIGFVGMPGSGKSVASEVARRMDLPVTVMGDVIRDEAASMGMEPTDQNLGAVGNLLREREGPAAVAKRCMTKMATLPDAGLVVVEGIRSKAEVEVFRRCYSDFLLVEVHVPEDIRLRRIAARGRSDDGSGDRLAEAVARRDDRELGWGMDEAIEAADIRIENDGTVEELQAKVRELLVLDYS